MTDTTTAGQPSSADLLARLEQMAAGGGLDQGPQPIGGYVGPATKVPKGANIAFTGPQGAVPIQMQMEQAAPIYFEGDERLPSSFAVEDVAALQRAMAAAGLLRGEFRIGLWDKKSRNAFSELLAFSNQQRVEWSEALNLYASSQSSEDAGAEGFLPARFQAMDPERVKQEIQGFAESRLDRMLSEQELNEMYAVFTKAERESFTAEQASQEDTYNRQTGIVEEGDLPAEVDPAARMRSVFERKYAGAISATEAARDRDARMPGLNTVGSTVAEAI